MEDYLRAVICPICGRINKVPDNLDTLVKTYIIRGDNNDQKKKVLLGVLDGLTETVRLSTLNFLRKMEQGDPNDWIDIECINKKKPYGKHYFRYNLTSNEISR